MTQYIYDGPGLRLVIGGQTIVRGRATELTGRAAEAAERHPGVRRASEKPAAAAATGPAWGSTVESALAYAGEDKARAAEVLEAEKAKGDKARKSLVEPLEALVAASDGDNGAGDGGGAG